MTASKTQAESGDAEDEIDIGEYANLCPDKNRHEFEFGSSCIVNIAKNTAAFGQSLTAPSKVKRELEHLDIVLCKLSNQAAVALNTAAGLSDIQNSVVNRIHRITQRAADSITGGRRKFDGVRAGLGRDAAAIWGAHGGKVDDIDFVAFVERLIQNAGFESDDKKSRIDFDALVREIRMDVKKLGYPAWQLW